MSSFEALTYETRDRVALITLNRPDRLNALDPGLMRECGEMWRAFKSDPDAWVAVLTGAGRAFCAGGDVKAFSSLYEDEGTPPGAAIGHGDGFPGWGPRSHDVQKPVIAAVNGVCSGGGLDFVTQADVVVASEDAEFLDSHVSIGWVSSHEAVWLTRKLPLGEVLMMTLMGAHYRLSASRAHELGFVQRIVPKHQVIETATEIARAICENSPTAVWCTKEAIWRGLHLPVDDAIELSLRYLLVQERRADHREGPAAFAQKRRPAWELPPARWDR